MSHSNRNTKIMCSKHMFQSSSVSSSLLIWCSEYKAQSLTIGVSGSSQRRLWVHRNHRSSPRARSEWPEHNSLIFPTDIYKNWVVYRSHSQSLHKKQQGVAKPEVMQEISVLPCLPHQLFFRCLWSQEISWLSPPPASIRFSMCLKTFFRHSFSFIVSRGSVMGRYPSASSDVRQDNSNSLVIQTKS